MPSAANPNVPPALVHTFAKGAWIRAGQPDRDSGTGKSHLLVGLGTAAALVNELVEAADDKHLSKSIARYGRVDLLCLDELGYLELDRRGAELLFQVFTEREERSSIAIASNSAFSDWARTFTDPRLCAAIVDRTTFDASIIETGTESFRLRTTKRRAPARVDGRPSGSSSPTPSACCSPSWSSPPRCRTATAPSPPCTRVRFVSIEGAFAGRLLDWAHTILRTTLHIVRKPADQRGFVVIPPLGPRSTPSPAGSPAEGPPPGSYPRTQIAHRLGFRAALVCTCEIDSREAGMTRKLTFGMNVTLDGYIAAPGDDLGWSGGEGPDSSPSDELFQWWSDRVAATGLALYGRKLWETMSSHWPTADQQPGATPAAIEFARRWRDMPKVVFSSTTSTVDRNTRLVTGDAVTEITRLKAEDAGPMDIGGATLAGAAMRAGLIDEYLLVTVPVLVGGGTPFFTALDSWVNLTLVETRTFPGGVVLARYETRR